MKSAMRAKDTNRLAVLRSLLSQTLNASKTSSPINTDMQMLTLLRKTANTSRAAQEEFKAAGREDLVQKEEEQLKVLEEYSSGVETVGEDEIRSVVKELVDSMKAEGAKMQMGDVLKRVFSPKVLGEKNVEKGEVAKIVKAIMAES